MNSVPQPDEHKPPVSTIHLLYGRAWLTHRQLARIPTLRGEVLPFTIFGIPVIVVHDGWPEAEPEPSVPETTENGY